MTTYYVDSANGNNANSGLAPTGTGGVGPKATIAAAQSLAVAGDTIYILPGNGYSSFTISTSGSAGGGVISYVAYPGTRPKINSTANFSNVQILADYIVFDGFEVIGNNSTLTTAGGWAVIFNNQVGSNGAYATTGVVIGDLVNQRRNVTVRNCWVHDHAQSGITMLKSDYVTINNNIIYNNSLYSGFAGAGISISQAFPVDGVTTAKIFVFNNICYNNYMTVGFSGAGAILGRKVANTSAQTTSGTTLTFTSHSFTVGCLIFDITNTSAIPVGTYIVSTTSTTVTLSTAVTGTVGTGDGIVSCGNTDGGGIIIDTNTSFTYTGRTQIFNNLVVGNGGYGALATDSNHCDFFFNTSYANHAFYKHTSIGDISAGGTSSDCNYFNNISVSNPSAVNAAQVEALYNGSGAGTFTANMWNGGNPLTTVTATHADPQFFNPTVNMTVANFRLKNTSTAINAANNTFTRTTDLAGRKGQVGSASDLGCYEGRSVSFPAM